jgi:type IV secretory pathway protease TraF
MSVDRGISEPTLGADEIYVLADNRSELSDSRMMGPIPRSAIRGKALFVFMSGPSLAGPGRIWKPLSAAK